jgi:alkanesulfonate monooxygenase SsuD/methylene tetrahydromethanopterin reductase-like flavin-dependent oxidoreductase (luciferase family)
MRFNFFHLMPYPFLPDDVYDRWPGITLRFPNRYFDPDQGHAAYHRYLDELEYADRLGFDGIACNEHHQTAYGIMPSPNIIAAALARRTSRAQIMVLGNAIGLRDHPLRIAEEIAMLDHLCDGRLASGFVRGIGWEYYGHSINPTKSRDRFNEAHDLIIKAWTSGDVFQWIGENYEFRYVNIWPRPLQKPHPPIFIPGFGSTETVRFCAKHRYSFMSVYSPWKVIKRWFDGYRAAAEEEGYEADPERLVYSVPIFLAETDEAAIAEARQPVEWLFHRALNLTPEIFWPPGYMSPSSLRGMLQSGMKAFPETSYEELVDERYVLVGSPSTVAEMIEELRQEIGFGAMNLLMAIGDMTHEQTIRSTELFASEVMPHFRTARATARATASDRAPAPSGT